MKADGSLKSLLQGVSQQPVRDRLPGQCTEQINMSSDPVKGLTRRPPTDLVGSLGDDADIKGWAVTQTEDGLEFIIKILSDGVKVFDVNATEYPVTVTGDAGYFAVDGRWSVHSVKGKTYLANDAVKVAMASTVGQYCNVGPGSKPMGIVQVMGGQYGRVYGVDVDSVRVASYETENGSQAGHVTSTKTRIIATNLAEAMRNASAVAVGGGVITATGALATPNWTVTRYDDLVWITKNINTTPFNLQVSDDAGNVNLKCTTDNVADIADLPRFAPHGYAVRIAQEVDPEDDLWLQFIADVPNPIVGQHWGSPGAWYETTAPGLKIDFDKTTMPRVLKYDPATQTFELGYGDWASRGVGTDSTNPEPSFVGQSISDISSFQSRLVMLAGNSIIASRSKKYENFWIGSASTIADSDPLDLTSQAAFASVLKWAVPHNKDLVIFSNTGQYVLFGRTGVTPANAALVLTTSFEAHLQAKPVPSGRNVFFSTKYGRFTGIREFFTEGGTDINDTRPITQHVNKYILGTCQHMSSTSNYDTLVVHTDVDKNVIYTYQFIWADSEKVQSAWSKWVYPHPITYSFFDDEKIYLVMEIGTQHYLLRLSLDVLDEEDVGYPVHLDALFDVDNVNTQFVLPYDWLGDMNMIVVQSTDSPNPGLPVRIESVVYSVPENGYVVTLRNNMQGGSIVAGVTFLSDYWPTMPRMKDADGVPISNARLQINQMIVSIEDTGHISGQKITQWGNGPEVDFDGYIANSPSSLVGLPALNDFSFKLPFKERADRGECHFYTNKHWPMTLLDIEWEGTINKRGKRLAQGDR